MVRRHFFLFADPFFALESRLCFRTSFFSDLRKYLGLSITSPLERTAKDFIPRSMPINFPDTDFRTGSHSTEKQANHLSASRLIVHVFMTPFMGRCNLIFIVPILESRSPCSVI